MQVGDAVKIKKTGKFGVIESIKKRAMPVTMVIYDEVTVKIGQYEYIKFCVFNAAGDLPFEVINNE